MGVILVRWMWPLQETLVFSFWRGRRWSSLRIFLKRFPFEILIPYETQSYRRIQSINRQPDKETGNHTTGYHTNEKHKVEGSKKKQYQMFRNSYFSTH